jgi:hypothetical protein
MSIIKQLFHISASINPMKTMLIYYNEIYDKSTRYFEMINVLSIDTKILVLPKR